MTQDATAPDQGFDSGLAMAMLGLTERIAPMHDWLAGERAYFLSKGYTADESRAMAAATYLTVFGGRIVGGDDDE